MTPAEQKWIRNIHIAKAKTGINDEQYRVILFGAAGVESAKDIGTWEQYNAVMAAFKVLGFTLSRNKTAVQDGRRNPTMITARQEYYIRGLWDLASRKKDEASLRALIRHISGADDIRFVSKKDAAKVILAVRDIADKAGYNPDEPPEEAYAFDGTRDS